MEHHIYNCFIENEWNRNIHTSSYCILTNPSYKSVSITGNDYPDN